MKSLHNISVMLAAVMTVSCAEEIPEPLVGNGDIRVIAGFAETKTAFVEDGDVVHVNWVKDDAISLFSESQGYLNYYAVQDGPRSDFRTYSNPLDLVDGSTVYACYPRLYTPAGAPDGFRVASNVDQNYGNPEKCDFLYASGVVKDRELNLLFKHFFAFLKITVPAGFISDRNDSGGLYIESSGHLSCWDSYYLPAENRLLKANYADYVKYAIPVDAAPNDRGEYICYIAILPQEAGSEISIKHFRGVYDGYDKFGDCLITKNVPDGGFKAGNVYSLSITSNEEEERREKDREALIALYNAWDGDNWTRNDNWCSDKPLSEWYGVGVDNGVVDLSLPNNNLKGTIPHEIGDLQNLRSLYLNENVDLHGEIPDEIGNLTKMQNLQIASCSISGTIPSTIENCRELEVLVLSNNDMSGVLPYESIMSLDNLKPFGISLSENNYKSILQPEFANIMSKVRISNNYFYGPIPRTVLEHPDWEKCWFDLIAQHPAPEGTLEYDAVLPVPSFEAVDFDGNNIVSGTEYRSNDLTLLFLWDTDNPGSITMMDKIVERYDRYRSYGIEVIGWTTLREDKAREVARDHNVPWRNFAPDSELYYGNNGYSILAVDGSGMILFHDAQQNPAFIYEFVDNWIINSGRDSLYESTDFSEDGRVTVLQEASEGNGIDVVLLGDAFSDRLIEDGTYRRVMDNAHRTLFGVEPFKSFRDFFNVYMVNVVSVNEMVGRDTALESYFGNAATNVNGNNNICFEYALKAISPERLDEAMIIVCMNSEKFGGTCSMFTPDYYNDYGSGTSVAYLSGFGEDTDDLVTLNHEVQGHGFAKLRDEYVNRSKGDITEGMKEYLNERYLNYGWSKNIDFTDDPQKVKWAHFLSDSRYSDDGLGVFEGGATYWKNVWRPSYESLMNCGQEFNAPSREAIYYRIHKLAYGEDWEYDYEKFVEYDEINRKPATRSGVPVYLERPKSYEHCPPVIYDHSWREAMKF